MEDMKEKILDALKRQKGVLFTKPAIVFRETYSGRDIIAKNSKFEPGYIDERKYVPVEWWVVSLTETENPIKKTKEGLTFLKLDGEEITLKEASEIAEQELFGSYKKAWPLTKILDIGGDPKETSFSDTPEVPPIPPHVHSGEIENGQAQKPGKLEAYFFPPLNIPPYNKELGKTISRLGLKKGVTKEEFKATLSHFGKNDSMYALLEPYEIEPYTGWTIPAGTVHAPGPWVTFEIQLPQDDFNLAGWRLGDRIDENEQDKEYNKLTLRGLKDEEDFLNQVVNWEVSTDPEFKEHYHRPIKIIEEGAWGRRFQIFFDQFYGEGWEITPGQTKTFAKKETPIGAIVWSGNGKLNDNNIDYADNKEFLITPNTEVELENNGDGKLIIFTVEPIKQ